MNQEKIRTFARYTVRLIPIVIIVAALSWFFLLRSPGGQTNTSGTTDTEGTPETTATTTSPNTQAESKVAEDSTVATTNEGKQDLPAAGPADTLALFVVVAVAGTLFWEWRLARQRI